MVSTVWVPPCKDEDASRIGRTKQQTRDTRCGNNEDHNRGGGVPRKGIDRMVQVFRYNGLHHHSSSRWWVFKVVMIMCARQESILSYGLLPNDILVRFPSLILWQHAWVLSRKESSPVLSDWRTMRRGKGGWVDAGGLRDTLIVERYPNQGIPGVPWLDGPAVAVTD